MIGTELRHRSATALMSRWIWQKVQDFGDEIR